METDVFGCATPVLLRSLWWLSGDSGVFGRVLACLQRRFAAILEGLMGWGDAAAGIFGEADIRLGRIDVQIERRQIATFAQDVTDARCCFGLVLAGALVMLSEVAR